MTSISADVIPLSMLSANDIKRKRWKYVGYLRFCEFIASDGDFFIFRRFSTLTARVLLALQDELSELESQLQSLEDSLYAKYALDIHNGSFRQETSKTRLKLIHTIHGKLKEYNELVIQHSELRGRAKVPQKDVASITNWFHNHKNAILAEETKYIDQPKDLFAIVPKSKTPIRKFLERSSHFRLFRLCRLWRKTAPSGDEAFQDENVYYISDYRINLFIALIITVIGLIMLIVPLWILAFVTWPVYRLATITLFVVVFLCFVSFTTVAKPFESLGAAAAYAAVLVVFLQIGPN